MNSTIDENTLVQESLKDGIQRFVVGAIIKQNNSVLLLKRFAKDFMGGIYELPSGKVEYNETLQAALLRETKEEIGCDIQIKKYVNYFDYQSQSGKNTRQFNILAEIVSGTVVLSDEHDEFIWASMEELNSVNVTASVITTIMAS